METDTGSNIESSDIAPVISKTAMTGSSKLKALKCTSCGGAIELRGGHNVKSIVCQYCGSCLDAKDSFKVLHKLARQNRPSMPFRLGRKGKLKGISFTVIGVVQYEQQEGETGFRWLEYLLFSPTHGYVYLCFSDGHWVFMREVKDTPDTLVEIIMPRKYAFTVRNKTFKVFEYASARAVYVEGELTWEAKNGEKIRYLDAICPPYQYTIEMRGKVEIEYFSGEYVTRAEMMEGFATDGDVPMEGIAPCQPFNSPILEGLYKGVAIIPIIALICYFIVSSNGTLLSSYNFNTDIYSSKGQASKVFKVDKPSLYKFVAKAPKLNNKQGASLDLTVIDKDELKRLFSMPVELSYFSGYDSSSGSWIEDERINDGIFNISEVGEYKIAIYGRGWIYNPTVTPKVSKVSKTARTRRGFWGIRTHKATRALATTTKAFEGFEASKISKAASIAKAAKAVKASETDKIVVDIYGGVIQGHYTLLWFFISILLPLLYFARKFIFEVIRWRDEGDDD